MNAQYTFGEINRGNTSKMSQITAVAFLTLGLLITEIVVEFLYKFNPYNFSQFITICIFSLVLLSWLLAETYYLSRRSFANKLLLLGIFQFIYTCSRELFLVLHFQGDTYSQYSHAISRIDFKALPFILIYCIIFALQLGQILKLFLEYERQINQDFLRILNAQPISIICFSRSDNKTVFINDQFKKFLGFNDVDFQSINSWLHYFKKSATPCYDISSGFSDFQTEIHNVRGENKIIRISRVLMDSLIIDVLVDVTEDERKNILIRQNQKELLSRSIADNEFALEQSKKVVSEYSTENKILISSLLKANKTLSSGALAASIAHEITQPLTAMNLNLELLLLKLNKKTFDTEKGQELARKIIGDNVRISSIIYSLRSIFMDKFSDVDLHSINEMVGSVVSLISPECRKRNIQLQLEISDDFKASFRPDEIRQVLLNVLGNAINVLENVMDRPRIIRITSEKTINFVELSISDSGSGVPSSLEPSLFELLTTTKRDGMGLGLWLSKYILTKSGGDIKYKRIKGWGATFQIQLPITFSQAPQLGGLNPRTELL